MGDGIRYATQLRAATALLGFDELTPTAKRILDRIADQWEAEEV